ncbi:MAG: class I SAM-dependent methyltransferase [Muribaculaceae bacterium]|nr:class I SAM-dependent methyltransferase [Muribaculaceae bacterium]
MAPNWDASCVVNPEKIRYILGLSLIKAGDTVLDVGTGTGVLIPFIEEVVGPQGHINAADISDGMLAIAKEKYPQFVNVDYINIDVENDQVPGEYDCMMMYCMYPHLERPYETLEWLYKINLKPGGHIVIAFPEPKEAINGLHRHNDGSVHSMKLKKGEDFARELNDMGINVDLVVDDDQCYVIRIAKPEA